MKVKATKLGYFAGKRRRVGEEFDYTGPTRKKVKKDGKEVEVDYLPAWMKPVDAGKKATAQVGDGDQPPPPKK